MLQFLRNWLRGKRVATVHNRVAAVVGALGLGLVAIVFARMGDIAQHLFQHLLTISPYAPFGVTPLVFAGVVHATLRWAPAARGSGIPQVMAASASPERQARGELLSLRTVWAKLGGTIAMLLVGGSVGREGPT